MLDTGPQAEIPQSGSTEVCDLCIIGAGIAGLNALHVATQYLGPEAKVILIDRNEKPGGMWTNAYDYVRLHQPHPSFTAGDIAWDWKKPRNYLAQRDEVQGHLHRCMTIAAQRVRLQTFFGWDFLHAEENDTVNGPRVRVTCRKGGSRCVVDAAKVINAIALDIQPVPPLALSSDRVLSTAPEALSANGILHSSAPVLVVGGGKTGMDTCLALLSANPRRHITLLSGSGAFFVNRDALLPNGLRRWWSGHKVLSVFGDLGLAFNGENEDEILQRAKSRYAISPMPRSERFFYGLLSEAECEHLRNGIAEVVPDYLSDVIDSEDGPVMALRSGDTRPVEPGTIVINCTGHILRGSYPDGKAISPGGTILTITARDAMHFLSSVGGYFMTHLFFLGLIRTAPVYMLDQEAVFKAHPAAWVAATSAQAFANAAALVQTVPFKVGYDCGLDLDRWYPLHRRMASLIDIKLNHRRYMAHCHKALDRLRERYNISGGLLSERGAG